MAMGGGGFSMEPDNPLLDDFVLSLARRQPARVCFVPTAILSRQVAVIRGKALIINLPGQPKSIAETLEGDRKSVV